MKVIKNKIQLEELKKIAENSFGNLVKAVVDIEKGIMAIDAEFHADEEALLLEQGSNQESLWGINIYPEAEAESLIEFDSMINIRPRQENRTRVVESEAVREKIIIIVNNLIER